MSDDSDSSQSNGPSTTSVAAQHAVYRRTRLKVAPTDGDTKFNALRFPLIPVACWKLGDPAFDFGSSFILPTFAAEVAKLAGLLQQNAGCPAALFAHADPAGSDAVNKTISDRRAIATYALLTRQPPFWEHLYANPVDGDTWGLRAIQWMLQTLMHPIFDADGNRVQPDEPYYVGNIDGMYGPETQGAVKQFQSDSSQGDVSLTVDGDAGPKTRERLFEAYMDALCAPPTDPSITASNALPPPATPLMAPADFLGGQASSPGTLPTMSLQGCGKFNPIVLLTSAEMNDSETTSHNADDASNRRVVLFFFQNGTTVDSGVWPCPTVRQPGDACKAAFWPSGDAQRQPGSDLKLYRNTQDTMACRFYDRFARRSPCEKAQLSIIEFFVYPDGQDGSAANDTMNATWGDQLRLGWMTSGLVKKVSITNTATGKVSDVTFATGTNDGVYSLGWAPLCVTSAATDENGVAEYLLSVQWTNDRAYDKCKVRVTMQGQNQESTYALAAIVDDDAAIVMGLGRRRDLATVAQT